MQIEVVITLVLAGLWLATSIYRYAQFKNKEKVWKMHIYSIKQGSGDAMLCGCACVHGTDWCCVHLCVPAGRCMLLRTCVGWHTRCVCVSLTTWLGVPRWRHCAPGARCRR